MKQVEISTKRLRPRKTSPSISDRLFSIYKNGSFSVMYSVDERLIAGKNIF